MYACSDILLSYESKRYGEAFVTRNVTWGLANIAQGLGKCLYIGNINALSDWGVRKTVYACSG
jgi:GDPmannose 4,6-dehydratase